MMLLSWHSLRSVKVDSLVLRFRVKNGMECLLNFVSGSSVASHFNMVAEPSRMLGLDLDMA
jgi:hypothetical protein